jgi:hypothetical protein
MVSIINGCSILGFMVEGETRVASIDEGCGMVFFQRRIP